MSDNRPKLMLATETTSAMFLHYKGRDLERDARQFLDNEKNNRNFPSPLIREIKSVDEIPLEWKNALLWGTDEEITAEGFLEDPEYKEYLRLKKKFEE